MNDFYWMPTIWQIPRSRNFTFIILFNFHSNLIMYAPWWWWWYLPPGIDVLVYSFLMNNSFLTKGMWPCWGDAISVFELSKVVILFSELTLLSSQSALIDERVILERVTCQRTKSSFPPTASKKLRPGWTRYTAFCQQQH